MRSDAVPASHMYVQDEGGGVRWKPFRKLIQPALDLVISLMVCVLCVMGLYKRADEKRIKERGVCVR